VTPGTRLGPYEILAPIGAGGMGEVYKGRDTRLDRLVAIKVSKEKFSERFEREARSIAALNHPHICQLYDVGPDYLVMEHIDGAPLRGPLPLDEAMKCAGQICDALDAAHKKGIVHRDLKPANILVTKVGVKLLDFGLARIATAAGDETRGSAAKSRGSKRNSLLNDTSVSGRSRTVSQPDLVFQPVAVSTAACSTVLNLDRAGVCHP